MADGVVAGLGIQPNVELARQAGLEVDNGIVVDASPAHQPSRHLRRRRRGQLLQPGAGEATPRGARGQRQHHGPAWRAGPWPAQPIAYDHLPFFYSDLFELGYEAVGELDSRLETVADWKEPYREGVVYYLRDGRVRGVLLWNVWEQVDAARKLIAEPGPLQRRRTSKGGCRPDIRPRGDRDPRHEPSHLLA